MQDLIMSFLEFIFVTEPFYLPFFMGYGMCALNRHLKDVRIKNHE